jgi:hypothetical protein
LVTGEAGAGFNIGNDGLNAGVMGEAYLGSAEASGVIGGRDLGLTAGVEVRGPGVHGMAGIYQNNVGLVVGGSLVSAEGSVGTNIAGMNVGVKGEVGLKAELGAQIGKDGVEVKLPIVSLGLTFGGAK